MRPPHINCRCVLEFLCEAPLARSRTALHPLPMRGFALLVAAAVRHFVSLHPHSGQATPPMYGDYEAQRHWMEVTWQLPVGDWYRNTTDNDLQCGI